MNNSNFNNVIIDISHHQEKIDLKKIKAAGIMGIMHKATEGTDYEDPLYKERVSLATEEGLLWGAYHFATASDPVMQAENFLNNTKLKDGSYPLLAIDLESNGKNTVTLPKAEAIMLNIYESSGRYPLIYGSVSFLKELLNGTGSHLFKCPLWIANWTAKEEPNLPDGWDSWTFWQYTDGKKGGEPKGVLGVEGDCDRDRFNGSKEQLEQFWPKILLS